MNTHVITSYSIHYTKLYEVATGVEKMTARDTGRVITAKSAGEVIECDPNKIVIKTKDGKKEEYLLTTIQRTNDFSAFYHRPSVTVGTKVKRGDLLADTTRITSYNVCYTKLLRMQSRRCVFT